MAYEAIIEARRDAESKMNTLREAIKLRNEKNCCVQVNHADVKEQVNLAIAEAKSVYCDSFTWNQWASEWLSGKCQSLDTANKVADTAWNDCLRLTRLTTDCAASGALKAARATDAACWYLKAIEQFKHAENCLDCAVNSIKRSREGWERNSTNNSSIHAVPTKEQS